MQIILMTRVTITSLAFPTTNPLPTNPLPCTLQNSVHYKTDHGVNKVVIKGKRIKEQEIVNQSS